MVASHNRLVLSIFAIWLVALCSACAANTPANTPDVQATIDAAIAATATAQAALQAQIDTSVEATITAMPTEAAPSETTAQPTEDYSAYSEEELVAEIDDATTAAVDTSTEAETAINQAAGDGSISQEEYEELVIYVDDLEAAIALAEELITAYYGYYGELAEETLYLLEAIEDDLDALYSYAEEVGTLLAEAELALEQGQQVAQETIDQLVAATENAQARRAEIETAITQLVPQWQAEVQSRLAELDQIIPSQAPANRLDAIQSAFDYVDAVRAALLDQALNAQELANIAQLGANAIAGLESFGGPGLQGLSSNISAITGQLARGQVPQAVSGLGALESALGARPKR